MKKLLIGLTILFSFLFISNVNASIIDGTYTINEDILNSDLYYNDFKTNNYDHTTTYDALIASGKLESFHEAVMNHGYKYYFYDNESLWAWNTDEIVVAYTFSNNCSYSGCGYVLKPVIINPNKENIYSYGYSKYLSSNKISLSFTYTDSYFKSLGVHYKTSTSTASNGGFSTGYYSSSTTNYYHFPGINTNKDIIYSANLANQYFSSYNYYSSININGKTYNDGDVIYKVSKEPQLTYKNSFVSNENYDLLGKVSVEFSEYDETIYSSKKSKFKLQFGSNDFTKENIPVFSHYKVYGKISSTNTWKELNSDELKLLYFDEENNPLYDDRNLNVIETTWDYSEGMIADASITLEINYAYLIDREVLCAKYEDWKIEFYFDNMQNGYIYVADTLENSKWTDTSKFLEDYVYYYFPSNYKYAFITSENNINEGKIYFPTNSVNNELVKIKGQYYSLKNKTYSSPIITNLYLDDTYYSYFDFYFNDNDNVLLLNRAVGSYTYTSWYNPEFLEGWNFLTGPLYWGNITSISEDTYFYAPIGYNVYFTNDSNITVNTSNGNINIDIENSNNQYESNIDMEETTSNSFFILFHKAFNYFISPISSILTLITSFFEVLPLGIQYSFYVAFGFMIALLIYKFVL